MKIRCSHGFYYFREEKIGEISDFISLYGLSLSAENDYYTFDLLLGAPKYSILGNTYLGADVIKTFEGEPHEILRQNELVYNFQKGVVEPISNVSINISIFNAGNYYSSNGLIVAGSIMDDGQRVRDYSATFTKGSRVFKYSEVNFE